MNCEDCPLHKAMVFMIEVAEMKMKTPPSPVVEAPESIPGFIAGDSPPTTGLFLKTLVEDTTDASADRTTWPWPFLGLAEKTLDCLATRKLAHENFLALHRALNTYYHYHPDSKRLGEWLYSALKRLKFTDEWYAEAMGMAGK